MNFLSATAGSRSQTWSDGSLELDQMREVKQFVLLRILDFLGNGVS